MQFRKQRRRYTAPSPYTILVRTIGTIKNGGCVGAGIRLTLRLQSEREVEIIGLFLFTVHMLAMFTYVVMVNNLRKLPRNVVLGAQALTAFLQRGKVTRRHHAGSVAR